MPLPISKTDSPFADIEKHFTVYQKKDEYCAWPAIARTADGDLVVLFTCTEEHISPQGKILLSRSKDNGETWEDPVVAFESLIDDRESGITAFRDGTLVTHIWSTHWNAKAYQDLPDHAYFPETIQPWIERVTREDYLKSAHLQGAWNTVSTDGGYTWSEPYAGVDSIHGGTELQSGGMLVAAYRQEGQNIGIYKADAPGKPWYRISNVITTEPRKFRFGEPHLTQLDNGRIILVIRATAIPYNDRSPRSYMYVSFSDDEGETWAAPFPTPLWGFPQHITQLSDGRVLATYSHRRYPYGERACISEDGITWRKEDEVILRADANGWDLGYPVSIELEPGRILTVYYQDDQPQKEKQQNPPHPPNPDRVKVGILGTIWKIPEPKPVPELWDIGERRELFVDGRILDDLDNCYLEMHEPVREDVAVRFNYAWEGKFSGYPTVLFDNGLYRLYYRGWDKVKEDRTATLCYAESRDGVNWTKPDLGLHEINGTTQNNVLLTEEPFTHNFAPFIDTKPGIPKEERYKAVAGTEKSGLFAFVSSNGIHWEKIREEPILTWGLFDSHNVVFWSEEEACYVGYYRTWTGEGYTGFRSVSRVVSADFLNWSDCAEMHYGNTPAEQIYTNGTTPYFRAPHVYLALAKRFFPGKNALPPEEGQSLVEDPEYCRHSSDSVFMSTRGGYEFDRLFMEAFIRPGPDPQDWIARDNAPALGIVPGKDKELYMYRLSHYAQPGAHLTRYSLRLDGFVSVEAPYEGGACTTRPLTFSGDRLQINYATSAAGELFVEILDLIGDPLPGFSAEECQLIFGDQISRVVSWQNGPDVSDLVGIPIRLRFILKDANLFSFRFFQRS